MHSNNQKFSFSNRFKSFLCALKGIQIILVSQHNAWIHFVLTITAVVLGFVLNISSTDWTIVILSIMAVWTAEALNTAFEFLADVASPEFHPLVEKAKDVAAGAVLLSAIGAALIGGIVFFPYFFN